MANGITRSVDLDHRRANDEESDRLSRKIIFKKVFEAFVFVL